MGLLLEYLTVNSESTGEYTEKRSKFISVISPCKNESEAAEILARIKSENFGANHNVYAYVLENQTARFSDDSEPHGTAGKPVLEVIEGNKLKNVIIVVTRYFGGVLLGTGGLVRAYTTAAKNAVNNAKIVKMCECDLFTVTCDYKYHEKLVSVIENKSGTITDTEFKDNIFIRFSVKSENSENLLNAIKEAFSSKIIAKKEKTGIFPTEI